MSSSKDLSGAQLKESLRCHFTTANRNRIISSRTATKSLSLVHGRDAAILSVANLTGDVFGSINDCGLQLRKSDGADWSRRSRSTVYQQQEGRGIGTFNKSALLQDGRRWYELIWTIRSVADAGNIECAEILFDLGLRSDVDVKTTQVKKSKHRESWLKWSSACRLKLKQRTGEALLKTKREKWAFPINSYLKSKAN